MSRTWIPWEKCPEQLKVLQRAAPLVSPSKDSPGWETVKELVNQEPGPERTANACRMRWRGERHYKASICDSKEQTGQGKTCFDIRGNTATAWSNETRIKTLEQLLGACEVDLDTWKVDHYLINKWEVGAKAEYKDLTWTGGTLDGTLQAEGLTIAPLFQVKAWLVRQHPEPIFPTIQPIKSAVTYALPPKPQGGILRNLTLADPHFWFRRDFQTSKLTPLHDRRVLDVILQIAYATQPNRIDVLGDILDATDWTTKFLRSPEFYWCTQPSLLETYWWLSQLRQTCPQAEINVYEGNHDDRMREAILQHLPAAYDLRAVDELELPPALSLPKLLALHQLGINWIGGYPDEVGWLNDGIKLRHGDVVRVPGNTTKAVVQRADVTEIVAHVHRIEWTSRTKFLRDGREVIAAFCPGCTCHIDGRVPATRGEMQWQNGCALVDYQPDGRMFAITPIVIDNGRAIWDGKLFEARDRVEDLRVDFPDWNW